MRGYEPIRVSQNGNTFILEVKTASGKSTQDVKSDQLLIATGREPNSDTLNIEKTGVKTDDKGLVLTNEYLETNVDGIYALGDAVGHYLFKHSANLEAHYDFLNLLSPTEKTPVDYSAMPHAIFSSPQIAGVGATEQKLKTDKVDYMVGKYNYIDTAMGEAIEDRDGFVKILADRSSRRILGCHKMGHDASTLIHEVLVAMKTGEGTLSNTNRVVNIHPALSEVVQRAAANVQ